MSNNSHISAAQIRAARSLINWSQDDLAEAAKLSVATIRKLELGHISPRGKTTDLIRETFERMGLEFIDHNGVRQKPDDIVIYQGRSGARAFFDDVYNTAKTQGGECIIMHPSAKKFFVNILGDYSKVHVERMTALKDIYSVKCIVTEDETVLPASGYCEYRFMSKQYVDAAPFYIYDNKYALIVLEAIPSPKIIVIQSRGVADALRHQFYSMWEKATPLNSLGKDKVNKRKTA